MKFDSILRETGEFGRYQIFIFALFCCPVCIFISYIIFGQIFITLEPDHWCWVPELDQTNLTDYEKKLISIPFQTKEKEIFDNCRMFDMNYSHIVATRSYLHIKPDDSWTTVSCRNGWTYDYTEYYPTAVSEVIFIYLYLYIYIYTLYSIIYVPGYMHLAHVLYGYLCTKAKVINALFKMMLGLVSQEKQVIPLSHIQECDNVRIIANSLLSLSFSLAFTL